jgi:hypothetical protein
MFTVLITFPDFSVSVAMSLPNSAGEPGSATQLGEPRPDFRVSERRVDLPG